ncbi:MAG: GNAT family N-acetyltransferase [Candidatus Nanoarchaeia archaeon]
MNLNKIRLTATGIRFSIEIDGMEKARGRLYVMHNDLHKEPFGLIEDLFVDEDERSHGYGTKIVQEMIKEARRQGCYKIVATSRFSRENVHNFYKKNGFEKYGYEFRLNL